MIRPSMIKPVKASGHIIVTDRPTATLPPRPKFSRQSLVQQKLQYALSQAAVTSTSIQKKSILDIPRKTSQLQSPQQQEIDRNTTAIELIKRPSTSSGNLIPRGSATARYRMEAAQVSFTDPSFEMTYSSSFMPGVHFYTFLASREDRNSIPMDDPLDSDGEDNDPHQQPNASQPKKSDSNMLQMSIPDTIVYGESGEGIWLYTDKDGYIQKTRDFQDKHVLEKLGSSQEDQEDAVVVCKEPHITPAKQLSDEEAYIYQGNQSRILSTIDLKAFLHNIKSTRKSFAIQKYIKCKGDRAFIVRSVYEANKPFYGWMISNVAPFSSSSNTSEDIEVDKGVLTQRLCTAITTDHGCTFVKLTEKGCTEVSELNQKIVRFLEQTLHICLKMLVADFFKDSAGKWWLLQVKGFQVKVKAPIALTPLRHHPTPTFYRLSSRMRRRYLEYRGVHLFQNDSDSEEERMEESQYLHSTMAMASLAKRNTHKTMTCKCCLMPYSKSELAFKMTKKMISDTLLRVRSRLPVETTYQVLENILSRSEQPSFAESNVAYETWSVCSFCYALYEKDQALQKIESKLSTILGTPTNADVQEGYAKLQDSVVYVDENLSSTLPSTLTLCRLLLIVETLFDIPKEIYDTEKAISEATATFGRPNHSSVQGLSRLYLRISFMGYTECIPVSADQMIVSTHIPSDTSGKTHASASRYLLPINLIRTIHFFVPRTPLQSKSNEASPSLLNFFTEENLILIQLIRSTEVPLNDTPSLRKRFHMTRKGAIVPSATTATMEAAFMEMSKPTHSIVLGATKIRMAQFKTAYVTKMDFYACMALSGEVFNLKGSVGFEKLRYIDTKLLVAQHRLRIFNGVYVPDDFYLTSDPLSYEWLDTLTRSTKGGINNNKEEYLSQLRLDPLVQPKRKVVHHLDDGPMDTDEELENILEQVSTKITPEQIMRVENESKQEADNQEDELEEEEKRNSKRKSMQMSASTPILPMAVPKTSFSSFLSKSNLSALKKLQQVNSNTAALSSATITPPPLSPKRSSTSLKAEKMATIRTERRKNPDDPSIWCVTIRVLYAYNLHSRHHAFSRWECHYTVFGQKRIAVERPTNGKQTSDFGGIDKRPCTNFTTTHKIFLHGKIETIREYLGSGPFVYMYLRNHVYSSSKAKTQLGEYLCKFNLEEMQAATHIQNTYDVVPINEEGQEDHNPREEGVASLKMEMDITEHPSYVEEALENEFAISEELLEGLHVMKKIL